MRGGRDARRRNRNIGTRKSGHGRDNRLVIPAGWPSDRLFHEQLRNPVAVDRKIRRQRVTFLVEPPARGFVHACTVDDIVRVLADLPSDEICELDLVVLRQPTKKQRALASVWGRLMYWADMGRYVGTAIHLDAQNPGVELSWSKSLPPDVARELERLRQDGHEVRQDRRAWVISPTLESIRATQLYRTLIHELGHLMDLWESYSEADHELYDDEYLRQRYENKPTRDKEAFAHRYADETRARLIRAGRVPFPRIFDEAQMRADGLAPEWFTWS